jgi:hypothetical protein
MLMRSPEAEEFAEIFRRFCTERRLTCPDPLIQRFIDKYYRRTRFAFRRCHPRDVLTHAMNYLQFTRRPLELTEDVLDHAFASCFPVDEGEE